MYPYKCINPTPSHICSTRALIAILLQFLYVHPRSHVTDKIPENILFDLLASSVSHQLSVSLYRPSHPLPVCIICSYIYQYRSSLAMPQYVLCPFSHMLYPSSEDKQRHLLPCLMSCPINTLSVLNHYLRVAPPFCIYLVVDVSPAAFSVVTFFLPRFFLSSSLLSTSHLSHLLSLPFFFSTFLLPLVRLISSPVPLSLLPSLLSFSPLSPSCMSCFLSFFLQFVPLQSASLLSVSFPHPSCHYIAPSCLSPCHRSLFQLSRWSFSTPTPSQYQLA